MDLEKIFACTLLGLLALLFTIHTISRFTRRAQKALVGPFLHHIVYPRIFPGVHIFNPTRGEVVINLLHWAAILFCNTYKVYTIASAGQRAGTIAIIYLLPLLAAPQISFVADSLGLSLTSWRYVHGIFGFVATTEGVLHSVIALRTPSGSRYKWSSASTSLLALSLLAVLGLVVRRYAYEVFLSSHLPLAILLAVALWDHVRASSGLPRILLLAAAGCFGASVLYLTSWQIFHNIGSRYPRLTQTTEISRSDTLLIVGMELKRPWRIEPGQYIYLRLLTMRSLSLFQRHPFTITWWDDAVKPIGEETFEGKKFNVRSVEDHTGKIYIMIDPQAGWTRSIMKHKDLADGVPVWLDGPYGDACKLHGYGAVLLMASGTGIFALLPFVKRLTEKVKSSRANTRRIKLVWYTEEYYEAVYKWMQTVLEDFALDKSLFSISIHRPASAGSWRQERIENVGQRLRLVKDIPDIHSYVQLELSQPNRSLAVAVSAFQEFRHDVRREVLNTSRDTVRLFELDYQPVKSLEFRGGTAA